MSPAETIPDSPHAEAHAFSAARCKHFGWCGGCATQDQAYADQLAHKEAELRVVLGEHLAQLKPIVPCADPWYYRNKMEFAFGFERDPQAEEGAEPAIAIGLRRKGRFYGVVNLEECFLMCEAAPRVLAAVRTWAAARGLPPYHLRRHQGLLRYVVMRQGKRTGELLVILVTAVPADRAAFEAALEDLGSALKPLGVTSLLWSVTDRQADLATGEIQKAVFGHPWFTERLAGVNFTLSPYAFFQPNVVMAERLIEQARGLLGTGWAHLVDLYCGVGGLTLALAGTAARATGIELDAHAVEDAGRNAAANGIANCRFVAEDSLTFLRRFSNFSFLADKWAAILDPPRSGMHPKMAAQILRVAPPVIIYVSCNPKKLAEDLRELKAAYRLVEATPYDFFPHTPHVEVLAKLVRT